MDKHFFQPVLAIVLGAGSGLLLSVFAQKLLNQHYIATCNDKPQHNLVLTQGFLGDTYYCIDAKYMN